MCCWAALGLENVFAQNNGDDMMLDLGSWSHSEEDGDVSRYINENADPVNHGLTGAW